MANFRPFLTGSRAYGIPKGDSDIDLVLYLDDADLFKLAELADEVSDDDEIEAMYGQAFSHSLRFGDLNLICCTDDRVFEAWRTITRELKQKAPVPRGFAVAYMAKRREELLLDQGVLPLKKPERAVPLDFDLGDADAGEDIPF